MRTRTMRRLAALALVAAALLVLGCSDDSTQPKVTKPRYPEATTKEIVISNLLLSYKDRNIEQYTKLLHDDYIWCNQAEDVSGGLQAFYTREEDVAHTDSLFLAATHKHPNSSKWLDRLKLTLTTPGSWQQIYNFNGDVCDDCWETTREYYLELVYAGGAMTLLSNHNVIFTVKAVEVDGKTVYRIIRCDDIRMP